MQFYSERWKEQFWRKSPFCFWGPYEGPLFSKLESSYSPDIDPSNTNKIHPTVQAPARRRRNSNNQFFVFRGNQNVQILPNLETDFFHGYNTSAHILHTWEGRNSKAQEETNVLVQNSIYRIVTWRKYFVPRLGITTSELIRCVTFNVITISLLTNTVIPFVWLIFVWTNEWVSKAKERRNKT